MVNHQEGAALVKKKCKIILQNLQLDKVNFPLSANTLKTK